MRSTHLVTMVGIIASTFIVVNPSNGQSQADRFALCRSVMELRPYDMTKDGPYPKKTNSMGMGWYPPRGLGSEENRNTGIWEFQNCSSIHGIYDPNQTTWNPSGSSPRPGAAVSSSGAAEVFDPPSNIRAYPNGKILCSVTVKGEIPVQGKFGDWYKTNYCGSTGYIHSSQLKF